MTIEYTTHIINGRQIEYLDVIYHTTTAKFTFWDRVRILFGKPLTISSSIYTKNTEILVSGSEAITSVEPFFKPRPKNTGGWAPVSEK